PQPPVLADGLPACADQPFSSGLARAAGVFLAGVRPLQPRGPAPAASAGGVAGGRCPRPKGAIAMTSPVSGPMQQDRLIIVGDEILSGRRQDKHMPKLIELLSQRGMQLAGAEFISDDRDVIASTLARSFAGPDAVFCCGGIGATPDDQTRQAAAQALGLP